MLIVLLSVSFLFVQFYNIILVKLTLNVCNVQQACLGGEREEERVREREREKERVIHIENAKKMKNKLVRTKTRCEGDGLRR